MLEFPPLLSDGCVLQQQARVQIWGRADAHARLEISLQGYPLPCQADEHGDWRVFFEDLTPGGPFCLTAKTDRGETRRLENLYVGEVWVCSGQSNMELPIDRVRDRFPEELLRPREPRLHLFQASEHYEFRAPMAAHAQGAWLECAPDVLPVFSALGYFFGKYLLAARDVPVGIISISKGGSRIEAWMPRKALAGYPQLLRDADPLAAAADTPASFTAAQEAAAAQWNARLEGAHEPDAPRGKITLPGYLADVGLDGFCGTVSLSRRFTVPDAMAGQPAMLWLGTLVDSDKTSINGVPVGETGYQYPPRKYPVPAGLLHAGENELTITLTVSAGCGRVTPGKDYCLFTASHRVELAGVWDYRVLRRCAPAPAMDFLCRKAAGLYNALVAPCLPYAVRGVLWYQGESNDFRPDDYADLLQRMISAWRQGWKQPALPFIVAQLPDFSIDLAPQNRGWPKIRQAQSAAAAALPGVALTVNLDLGEDNDLHPLNKKGVAERAAAAALRLVYGEPIVARGPVLLSQAIEGSAVRLRYDTGDGAPLTTLDGSAPGEFELAGSDRHFYPAVCRFTGAGDQLLLRADAVSAPVAIRYAFCNAPRRGLLCNQAGLPASPFRTDDWEV